MQLAFSQMLMQLVVWNWLVDFVEEKLQKNDVTFHKMNEQGMKKYFSIEEPVQEFYDCK